MGVIKIELTPELISKMGEDIVIKISCNNFELTKGCTEQDKNVDMFDFMLKISEIIRSEGRIRTSETYLTTMRSLQRFWGAKVLPISNIDRSFLQEYEIFLKKSNLVNNSISFYMRRLRAVYNRAVTENLITDTKPFKMVYTGADKTKKRAVSLMVIKKIRKAIINDKWSDFARDMFFFSFYCRGMSFVDMSYAKKDDVKDGYLIYKRHKTGQKLKIKMRKEIEDIINKYAAYSGIYLLPIIRRIDKDERRQYLTCLSRVNLALKSIARNNNISENLTMYVARHSWASIAKNMHIPTAVISDAMGHTSERTTQIYLNQIDTHEIDKANDEILEQIFIE